MRYRLFPHPSAPAPAFAIEAGMRRAGGAVQFSFRVTPASTLVLPQRDAPARADGLWRTTCFEAFIRPGAGDAYVELNFAPSMQWAAYRFFAYRTGKANADMRAPEIAVAQSGRAMTLTARLDADALLLTPSARIGLSAVLEEKSGAKSYWALAHTDDKPDFHRAGAFIARLPFESRA